MKTQKNKNLVDKRAGHVIGWGALDKGDTRGIMCRVNRTAGLERLGDLNDADNRSDNQRSEISILREEDCGRAVGVFLQGSNNGVQFAAEANIAQGAQR